MTEAKVSRLGLSFATFLRVFWGCFGDRRTFDNFVTYCRELLGSVCRKCVEQMALASGAGVRTLPMVHEQWQMGSRSAA